MMDSCKPESWRVLKLELRFIKDQTGHQRFKATQKQPGERDNRATCTKEVNNRWATCFTLVPVSGAVWVWSGARVGGWVGFEGVRFVRFVCLSRVCPGSPRCLFTGIIIRISRLEFLQCRPERRGPGDSRAQSPAASLGDSGIQHGQLQGIAHARRAQARAGHAVRRSP